MRKNARKTLCALFISACTLWGTAATLSLAKLESAQADQAAQTAQTQLLSPNSFEEYLPLQSPSGLAASANYTAIADGNLIYLYDRANEQYKTYEHKENISKVQFDAEQNLYFSDALTHLYCLTFEDLASPTLSNATSQTINCSTFIIHENFLYYTVVADEQTSIRTTNLSFSNEEDTPLIKNLKSETPLAFWERELYFTSYDGITQTLYKVSPSNGTPIPVSAIETRIQYMVINAGVLAYTTSAGDFYAYPLSQIEAGNELIKVEQGDFTTLSSHGDFIYATQKSLGAVKQYSISQNAFTDHEIAAASKSLHRLNGAVNTELCGNLLFTLDNANQRVSVYNTARQKFLAPVPTSLAPTYLAASKNTLLIANKEKAELYDISAYTQENATQPTPAPLLLKTFENFQGQIAGVSSVHGNYYMLTQGYAYRISFAFQTGEWLREESKKTCTSFVSPKCLTSSVDGDLFITTGTSVYQCTELEFMQEHETGKEICTTLPANTSKIKVDYNGNLYALSNAQIQVFKQENQMLSLSKTFDFSTPTVYTNSVSLTSFTFDVEENQAYVLCNENYLLQTQDFALPTVKTIPTNAASEEIFSQTSAQFSLVQTAENAFSIAFDIQSLQGASVFPYLSHQRETQSYTALEIGKTGDYSILAIYHESKHAYTTYLMKSSYCTPLSSDLYQKDYAIEQQTVGYITNQIPIYKFPYLTALLTAGEAKRGAEVTLLGEINQLDHEYYRVAYTSESGEQITGYIPKKYITDFSGLPPVSSEITAGSNESNHDALWRLAYIILGFTAIGILTDWLLLKKRRNDEE